MKGRVTYDQLNAAVQTINTAVAAKYKILRQSVKTLNNHSRKLQQRFKEQETKDTKGTVSSPHSLSLFSVFLTSNTGICHLQIDLSLWMINKLM